MIYFLAFGDQEYYTRYQISDHQSVQIVMVMLSLAYCVDPHFTVMVRTEGKHEPHAD